MADAFSAVFSRDYLLNAQAVFNNGIGADWREVTIPTRGKKGVIVVTKAHYKVIQDAPALEANS